MTPQEALTSILESGMWASPEDAEEILAALKQLGFVIVPINEGDNADDPPGDL